MPGLDMFDFQRVRTFTRIEYIENTGNTEVFGRKQPMNILE